MRTQRKRCGRCFKQEGTFIPVTVVSCGREFESWAHQECISAWSNIAHVQVDPTRQTITQAKLAPYYQRRKIMGIDTPMYSTRYDVMKLVIKSKMGDGML